MRHATMTLKAAMLAGCGWLALGPGQAKAQEAPAAYAIPAQGLGAALTQLGRQSGREILFSSELVGGLNAPDVRSTGDIEQTLSALLQGTGLTWRRNASGTYIIERGSLSAGNGDQTSQVEEVIVTAQRREERGQDVPIAVTAFGRGAIDSYRLETLRDVSRLTPGLLVANFNYSRPNIAIRGANNTFAQIGASKPVQVIVDDVVITRNSAANFELFGLDSIQVLKGPQGTLFGRNVTGGAILIDSGRPTFGDSQSLLRATVGNYDATSLDLLVDRPIGDRLAMRLVASHRARDGFGRDRLTGEERDDLRFDAIRAQVRAQVAPTVEALIGIDYADDGNNSRNLSITDGQFGDDGDPRTAESGVPQNFDRTQWGLSARIFADLFGGELTSITALRQSQFGERFAQVGANFRFLPGGTAQMLQQVDDDRDEARTFTQELRYASPRWRRGDFILGVYYLNEHTERVLRQTGLRAVTGVVGSETISDESVDSRSLAVFADGTFRFNDQVGLTLGARYTEDRREAQAVRTVIFAPSGSFAASGEREFAEVTPRAVLTWTPTADLLAYASYTRGYTAGGINTNASTLADFNTPFAAETLANHEVGVKSNWLDGRLRANLTVFRQKYEDKQELSRNATTGAQTILNAAQATMSGAEVELWVRPTSWLRLEATYGALDTEYDRFVIPSVPAPIINTGNALGSSPREKTSFTAEVRLPVGGWGEAFGLAVYSRTSGYNTGGNAAANLLISAYSLVNLSAGLASNDDKWRVTLFARNFEDRVYPLTYGTLGPRTVYVGEPRTVGVTLDISL